MNTAVLLLSFPFLSSIKSVYSHQYGNMNEEIDGGLGKDKKRENVKKLTFENQAGLCCRLESIMTDTQTPEDQAADLDKAERDANH